MLENKGKFSLGVIRVTIDAGCIFRMLRQLGLPSLHQYGMYSVTAVPATGGCACWNGWLQFDD